MTFALTSVKAYGVEATEPLAKRFIQRLELKGTAAATNVAYDFGNYTGTFWSAVGSTEPGLTGLKTIKGIQAIAKAFLSAQGTGLNAYTRAPASDTSVITILSAASTGGNATETYTVTGLLTTDTILAVTPALTAATGRATITALTSAVYAGGSATPTLTVTGLKTTDTILAATQIVKNVNSLPLIAAATSCGTNDQYVVAYSADPGGSGTVRVEISRPNVVDAYTPVAWNTQAAGSLKVVYGADPGAGAKVLVTVSRAVTAVPAGSYQLTMDATNGLLPDILFLSTDAPTAFDILLTWELPDGLIPIASSASA